MPGPVALVGAGEFLPGMVEFDRGLLQATGQRRPRVAIVPTASWPDGEAVYRRWMDQGAEHFSALGAEVETVFARDRDDAGDAACIQAIGEADLVYLSGGKPGHLLRVLLETPLGAAVVAAHHRGAVIAGCSAGAMALAGTQLELRTRLPVPWPLRWRDGLGLVPGVAVLPHYDAWPEPLTALVALQAPRDGMLLGIDEETAIVGHHGAWQVHGRGRVTRWQGRRRERFRRGEAFRL
jgi:cyanophycinase